MRGYDVYVPDMTATLQKAAQIRSMKQENKLKELRLQDAVRDRAEGEAFKGLRTRALGGDTSALSEMKARDPSRAANFLKLQQLEQNFGRGELDRRRGEATRLADMVMRAPQEQKAQVYAQARNEAVQAGLDVDQFPAQYSPEIDSMLSSVATIQEPAKPYSAPGKIEADVQSGLLTSEQAAEFYARQERKEARKERIASTKASTKGLEAEFLPKELAKQDVKKLGKIGDAASAAESLLGDVGAMRAALEKVKGTGLPIVSSPLAALLPGGDTKQDREVVKALATKMQLQFTKQTKGAISDKEMSLFAASTPGLRQTPGANKKILDAMEVAAERAQEKEVFFRQWIETKGGLSGAENKWDQFVKENPVIGKDFKINDANVGAWESYLNTEGTAAKKAEGATTENITNVSKENLLNTLNNLTTPGR